MYIPKLISEKLFKKQFLVASCQPLMKKADPDPYQNVKDSQHCFKQYVNVSCTVQRMSIHFLSTCVLYVYFTGKV
jgi:hypothetical protein